MRRGVGTAYEHSPRRQQDQDVNPMDDSQEAVKMAQSALGNYKDKVVLGDVFNADFSHSFDVIYERAFLAALPRDMWSEYFAMVDKLLPSGGFLIGFFVIDDNYLSRFPPFCLRSGELAAFLEPTFELVESSVVVNSVEVFKGREQWMVWQKR
ncbi:methyltransferase domain-containing protein, partial [Vibrio parahaemolyticus]|nr:methyltransferase domain-containing protein [Vibrio parahaemolyticus]